MSKKKTQEQKSETTHLHTTVGILSEEQYKVFDKYHSAFNNAVNFDVLGRTDKKDELELSQIYYEVTGFQITNWNCNSCRLHNFKKLGKLYFQSKKHYEAEMAKKEEETRDETTETTSEC